MGLKQKRATVLDGFSFVADPAFTPWLPLRSLPD
jgi:hypothetical protein